MGIWMDADIAFKPFRMKECLQYHFGNTANARASLLICSAKLYHTLLAYASIEVYQG